MSPSARSSTSQTAPSVLFVSPGPSLANPASGEGTRLQQLSRGLDDRGWDVLALVPESSATSPDWVRRTYTYEQWSLPFLLDLNPSFVCALARVLRAESVDVIHTSNGVCTASVLTRLTSPETTVSYASQNVEADHARDFVDPELPVYKRVLGPRLIPWIERATIACADLMTTVSEKDRETFIEWYGVAPERITAIPTGTQEVDESSLEPPDVVRERLGLESGVPVAVFHGSYAHPPNEEAFELLAEEIAPTFVGEVQFLLVGKGVPELGGENVVVAGFVEDLFSVLHAADFAVVPILHGGGTKTKLYDYISLGLPIVTTEKGVEGVDLEDGVHALVTDGAGEEFTEAVAELAESETRWAELRENLVDLSEALSWSRSVERLARFY